MFLTAHASAALWISTQTNDPLLAFVMGFLSHFVLDAVPHGDESFGKHISNNRRAKYFYLAKVAFVDIVFAATMIAFYFDKRPAADRTTVSLAVFGSWLPDFLWLANGIIKVKILNFYTKVHDRIHRLINWHFSPVYGVPFQIIVSILILKAIF